MPEPETLPGPDFAAQGAPSDCLADGQMLPGHFGEEQILLVRSRGKAEAIGATCTHYGGPLAEGVFDGTQVHCPWHQACFEAHTGEASRAPALDPVPAYQVTENAGVLRVTGPAAPTSRRPPPANPPESVVIVGAGAAGAAAAEALRREGYQGPITLVGAEEDLPIDRPVLSKGYLAGKASEEWVPLRPAAFYSDHGIGVLTGRRIASIDRSKHLVRFDDAEAPPYGALLLATGAEPIRLAAPGADLPQVHLLRSFADARGIVAGAASARRAVVIGASFIGLEVAASLVARGLEVQVVAPEPVPLARVLGDEIGSLVRSVHEGHGVAFHLGHTAAAVTQESVVLEDGSELPADLVVAGIGVRPRIELAATAGLAVDRAVVVDEFLTTSDPAIWASGDIALWPHPRFGPIRVEHWVAAQRQGQTAAANILGARRPHADVPFFWSRHFDFGINYVGRAASWDEVRIAGSVAGRDFAVGYLEKGRVLAVATANRDRKCLEAAIAFEKSDEQALERIVTGD